MFSEPQGGKIKLCSLWACVLIIVLLPSGFLAAQSGSKKESNLHPQEMSRSYKGGLVSPPLPKPKFTLTDTSGAQTDFWKKTEGHVTLLFFGYTRCPDECPLHMANIAAALKLIPASVAKQIEVVFVTTDPDRDTAGKSCAHGSITLTSALLVSAELKRRSMLLSRLPRYPLPKKLR